MTGFIIQDPDVPCGYFFVNQNTVIYTVAATAQVVKNDPTVMPSEDLDFWCVMDTQGVDNVRGSALTILMYNLKKYGQLMAKLKHPHAKHGMWLDFVASPAAVGDALRRGMSYLKMPAFNLHHIDVHAYILALRDTTVWFPHLLSNPFDELFAMLAQWSDTAFTHNLTNMRLLCFLLLPKGAVDRLDITYSFSPVPTNRLIGAFKAVPHEMLKKIVLLLWARLDHKYLRPIHCTLLAACLSLLRARDRTSNLSAIVPTKKWNLYVDILLDSIKDFMPDTADQQLLLHNSIIPNPKYPRSKYSRLLAKFKRIEAASVDPDCAASALTECGRCHNTTNVLSSKERCAAICKSTKAQCKRPVFNQTIFCQYHDNIGRLTPNELISSDSRFIPDLPDMTPEIYHAPPDDTARRHPLTLRPINKEMQDLTAQCPTDKLMVPVYRVSGLYHNAGSSFVTKPRFCGRFYFYEPSSMSCSSCVTLGCSHLRCMRLWYYTAS